MAEFRKLYYTFTFFVSLTQVQISDPQFFFFFLLRLFLSLDVILIWFQFEPDFRTPNFPFSPPFMGCGSTTNIFSIWFLDPNFSLCLPLWRCILLVRPIYLSTHLFLIFSPISITFSLPYLNYGTRCIFFSPSSHCAKRHTFETVRGKGKLIIVLDINIHLQNPALRHFD